MNSEPCTLIGCTAQTAGARSAAIVKRIFRICQKLRDRGYECLPNSMLTGAIAGLQLLKYLISCGDGWKHEVEKITIEGVDAVEMAK
jgi:hypothetical protein